MSVMSFYHRIILVLTLMLNEMMFFIDVEHHFPKNIFSADIEDRYWAILGVFVPFADGGGISIAQNTSKYTASTEFLYRSSIMS